MKSKTVYTADDGKQFDTAEDCRAHEQQLEFGLIEGLNADDITAVLAGKRPEIAMAIERLGRALSAQRIAAGGSRRGKKGQTDEPAPTKSKAA